MLRKIIICHKRVFNLQQIFVTCFYKLIQIKSIKKFKNKFLLYVYFLISERYCIFIVDKVLTLNCSKIS